METIQIFRPRFEEYACALKTTKYRQIRGRGTDYNNGRCVLHALIDELGLDKYDALPDYIKRELFLMNEYGTHTFEEMAEWLRAQK